MTLRRERARARRMVGLTVLALAACGGRAGAAPGALDLDFGSGGVVTTDFSGGNDTGLAIAVQPDARILVVGDTTSGSGDFALARYLASGEPDLTFGTGGGRRVVNVGLFDAAVSVVPLIGGKILVGGAGLVVPRGDRDFVVARLLADGALDTTFGVEGLALTDVDGEGFNETVHAMAVQPDGGIILGGDAADGFALVRHLASGALDTDFGVNGVVRTQTSTERGDAAVRSLALQSDGRILAAGDALIDGVLTFAVVRYLSDGRIDTGFGIGGTVSANFPATVRSILAQSDGTILLAGSTGQNFFVVRLLPDGMLDGSFANQGFAGVDFGGIDTLNSMLVDRSGKIILSGTTRRGNQSAFAVARLTPSGAFDTTFAGVGALFTPVGATDAVGNAAALQSDGRILVAGTLGVGVVRDMIAIRYEGDPAPPRDIEGWRTFYFGSPENSGDAADSFDFDLDGLSNFLEFAFRLDPTVSSAGQVPAALVQGGRLTLAFPDPGVDGVRLGAEWSQTLGAAPGIWTSLDREPDRSIHVFSAPVDAAPGVFMRLTATPDPVSP